MDSGMSDRTTPRDRPVATLSRRGLEDGGHRRTALLIGKIPLSLRDERPGREHDGNAQCSCRDPGLPAHDCLPSRWSKPGGVAALSLQPNCMAAATRRRHLPGQRSLHTRGKPVPQAWPAKRSEIRLPFCLLILTAALEAVYQAHMSERRPDGAKRNPGFFCLPRVALRFMRATNSIATRYPWGPTPSPISTHPARSTLRVLTRTRTCEVRRVRTRAGVDDRSVAAQKVASQRESRRRHSSRWV